MEDANKLWPANHLLMIMIRLSIFHFRLFSSSFLVDFILVNVSLPSFLLLLIYIMLFPVTTLPYTTCDVDGSSYSKGIYCCVVVIFDGLPQLRFNSGMRGIVAVAKEEGEEESEEFIGANY